LSLVLAACGGSSASEDGGGSVSGKISIEGSSTVLPITQAASEAFSQ
jgi:ABC-type phosphate transport system substrate-binding protein